MLMICRHVALSSPQIGRLPVYHTFLARFVKVLNVRRSDGKGSDVRNAQLANAAKDPRFALATQIEIWATHLASGLFFAGDIPAIRYVPSLREVVGTTRNG
jgi:hypothetical protein